MKKIVLLIYAFLIVAATIAQTPVAYYPFAGNANDVAGTLNGTVNGATLTTDRFGNANSAYSFDGVDDFISTANIATGQTDNWSITAWVKPSSISQNNGTIVINGFDDGVTGAGFAMVMGDATHAANGNLFKGLLAGIVFVNSGFTFSTNNIWYHTAMVREAGITKLYFNGVLSGTTSANVPNLPTGSLRIGSSTGIRFWNGAIDEVKIYNTALTAIQVQQEYTSSSQVQKPGSGNAISFDGVDDRVVAPIATTITDNFSMEGWVYLNALTASNQMFFCNGNSFNNGWGLLVNSSGAINIIYGGVALTSTVTQMPLNSWKHIALTRASGVTSVLLDGVIIFNNAISTPSTPTGSLNIGSNISGAEPLNGIVDEVKIWNVGLSQTEIRDRMCRKITNTDALYPNLVAYYNFDESTGNTVFDGTINANNGTLSNSPTRLTSGAAIGNTSTHNYVTSGLPAANLTVIAQDNLAVTYTAGTFTGEAGTHIYAVEEVPNTTNGISGVGTNNRYFGVFNANLTAPAYTATYNYTGNPFVTVGNEASLALYKRTDNAATAWSSASASLNTTANTLTATGQNTEYMAGIAAAGNISLTGALAGEYATLKEAFDAVNTGGGSGAVTATVNNNTTETVQAVLNQTNYTVSVVPLGNRIIEGTLNSALILLNGADNVTFNGQSLTGANTLTIRNTSATTAASVIRLLDAASNNIIKKCILEGSSNGTTVTQGVLVVTVTTLGNSVGNVIDSNIIRRASAAGVNIGIVLSANNTSATSTINNMQLTNNSIESTFIPGQSSFGILVQNNCLNTVIKGNSIYSTVPIVNTVNTVSFNAIIITSRGTAIGSGATIDSNYIGGSTPACGGSKMTISSPNNSISTFCIAVSDNTNANATTITRNVIKNIDVVAANPTTATSNPFVGTTVSFANLQAFNNNTLGDVTNNSVSLAVNPSSTGAIGGFGFLIQTPCATPIANNFVGGLNITGTSSGGSTVAPFFIAMDIRNGSANNVKNNSIGAATPGNISLNNTATGLFTLQGIIHSAPTVTATASVDSNTVRNIAASHTSFAGIVHSNSTTTATAATVTMNGNAVSDISVLAASSTASGIFYSVSAGVANLVHTLTASGNTVNNITALSGSNISLRGMMIVNSSTSVNRIKGRIENNSITNISNSAAGTAGFARGISFSNDIITGDSMVLASNTVNNISDAGASVNTGITVASFGNSNGINVLMLNSGVNGTAVIRDNAINNISTTATDNAPVKVHALSVFGNAAVIERNKIYALQNASTSSTALLAPILLRSRNDDANISVTRNNMIAINTTTQAQIAGVCLLDGTVNANIYHNSILTEGSSAASSFALLKDANSVTDVKNNILYNGVTGAGTAYAIGLQNSAAGYTGNNNYFVSTGVTALAQINGTDHTLATWQAATTQDAATKTAQSGASTNAADLFINKAIANLLINTSNATEPVNVSNSGMALSAAVPEDYLGTLRNTTTPDIGAHEFVFTALPVTLLNFTGTKQNNNALLQWQTANEINVSRFEVQRSENGQTFSTIGTVTAGGSIYSLTDANIFNSRTVAFYRLKSIDVDGRFTYSNIIKLNNQADAAVTVFPNPVKNVLTVNGLKQNGTILLYSSEGKLLHQQTVSAQTITVDMSKYAKGMYLLQYKTGEEVVNQKIIKQ